MANDPWTAMGYYLTSSLLDAFDGAAARALDQTSSLGGCYSHPHMFVFIPSKPYLQFFEAFTLRWVLGVAYPYTSLYVVKCKGYLVQLAVRLCD